jgi:uncharacterized protein (TIGR02466 family)
MNNIEKHTLQLFPTTVSIYDTDIDTSKIRSLIINLIEIGDHAHKKSPNIWQSLSGQNKHDEIEKITAFIIECAQDYADQMLWRINKEDWYIADCWWNASTGDSSTHFAHIHANSLLSAVFYVSMPEGAGSLIFPHPQIQTNSIKPDNSGWNIMNSLEYAIKPKTGSCVIFRSNTPHMVDQNHTDDLRISLAFTLNVKNLGQHSHLASYENYRSN